MKYWVMKGNSAWYNWDRYLRPGREEFWHARRFPKEFEKDHRIFFWESGPKRRIIGLGIIIEPDSGRISDGQWRCRVRYLTGRLGWMPGIEVLSKTLLLQEATFLKSGRFGTAYPLTPKQAAFIYRTIVGGNPNCDLWPELSGGTTLQDVDELNAKEGSFKLIRHLRRERSRKLIEAKKAAFRKQYGKLYCEGCGKDYLIYANFGHKPFEVHHRSALGSATKSVKTSLSDLAVVCSNCHRVIHRTNPMISVEKLAKVLRQTPER